jgi:hypothetical protein
MDAGTLMLSGIDLPGERDPLGIWSLEPPEAAAFGLRDAEGDSLLWRVNLPDSAREADDLLQRGLRTVEEKREALMTLEAAFPRMTPDVQWQPGDRTVESELWAGVLAVKSMTASPADVRALGGTPGDLIERGQQLIGRLRRLLTHLAWVETAQSGAVIGITRVDWRGDFETTWSSEVSEEGRALHLKSVRLALASRLALLQMVTVVIGGALALAARASVPGGQVLLIPVVYGYVRDILEAWARIRETSN